MHVAHPAPRQRLQEPALDAPFRPTVSAARPSARAVGQTGLALAVLLLGCSLSLIDGLLGNVVAYERDTSDFYYPLMVWASQQLHQGSLPLWAPQIFAGYPIFADGEVGLASPPVLLALLSLPPDRAFVVLRLAHLCVAAVGCYALARAWGLTQAGSTVAGLTFALGSFLQAMAHHENIVRTAAWLPLVLALVEPALRRPGRRARLGWTAAAGLALGLAGLSLHSQILAIELLVLGGYALFRWCVGPVWATRAGLLGRLRVIAPLVAGVVALGLGTAAVQLLPLVELAGFSPRGSGIPYRDAAAYSLTPLGLSQLVFPFFFRAESNEQWGLWTHWESYLYVGLAPLMLAVVALVCVRRREVVGWAALGLVGLVLALGQYSPVNLHYWLWLLPGLSGLRAPGRFSLIVVLAAAMLAAHGLSWLQRRAALGGASTSGRRARVERVLLALAALPVALAGLLVAIHTALLAQPNAAARLIDATYLSQPRDVVPLTTSDVYAGLLWATSLDNPRTLGALLGLLVLGGLLLVWQTHAVRRRAGRSPAWPGLLVGATLLDLVVFSWSIHPRASLASLGAEPAAARAVEQAGGPQPFRVLASPVLNQVASDRLAPFGLQDANGYSSLESTWHRELLHRALRIDDQFLDLLNVRYILDPARFGAVPSHRDVAFLPQQPMLQGRSGSSLSDQTFRPDAPTTVVEVRLVLALFDTVNVPQGAPVGEVILRDPDGQVVAQHTLAAGQDVMDWAWDLPSVQPFVQHARAEVAGIAFEDGPPPNQRLLSFGQFGLPNPAHVATVELRASPPHGELAVYGVALIDDHGAAHQLFGRHNTKYREVYRGAEIAVLENTAALPRAFVVSGAQAVSAGSPLDYMQHQPFSPASEVVVAPSELPAGLPSPSSDAAGAAGSAQIEAYGTSEVRVHASAARDGLLVLSDSFYPGWRAFVDGREAPILRGDELFRVVPLPAGDHQVEFRFEPLSIKVGLLVTVVAVVTGASLLFASWWGSRSCS